MAVDWVTPRSVLPDRDLTAPAAVAGAGCAQGDRDADSRGAVARARGQTAQGKPATLAVAIDPTQQTCCTRGGVMVNLGRLTSRERLRMLGRAASRRVGR